MEGTGQQRESDPRPLRLPLQCAGAASDRAPHSLTVLLHLLSIAVANQLEELLVPEPGVGPWD
ncbi:hypothetical protein EYF80_003666 [Liparis tanakae]|uniref:Uncharacterized protein n=1 Tax=Liparis tanakae TaxID=230148 RepID=A0A4Z2J7U0_9TELE|nr:hypothetical protein EYF80_003666 [Liparis tanakae]